MPEVQIVLELLDQVSQLRARYSITGNSGFYGGNHRFIEGLERRREKYIVSVPADFMVRII